MNHAVIVAAGEGKRFISSMNKEAQLSPQVAPVPVSQCEIPLKKQFMELAGQPVLMHTLAPFQASPLIDTLVCVVAKEDISFFEKQIGTGPGSKIKKIVAGGAHRQDSVAAGLFYLEEIGSVNDLVVVHDGVRPFVTPALIKKVIDAASSENVAGAAAALPVTDALKEVSPDGVVQKSIPRDRIWAMQTPQVFRLGRLLEAMRKAAADRFVGADEVALVERMDHPVRCVEGDADNIKITTASDLKRAEQILRGLSG